MNDDKDQAMFTFVLLSMLLVLPCTRSIDDKTDRDFQDRKSPSSSALPKNVYASYAEVVHWDLGQLTSRRRLLEHPRWIKQAYRSNDYSVLQRRRQPRYKLDEGRSYRSAVKDEEDEDEDEGEEEEEDNENDENEKVDEEAEEVDENAEDEEETVGSASGGRAVKSGYMPHAAQDVNRRARRQETPENETPTAEECEETESPEYYEYGQKETQVKDIASRDADVCRCMVFLARMLGASLLILLLA